MATIPDVERRIRAVLQAKYARDQRWDFFGYLIVRGLMLPGCAACRASADVGARELAFLLHEHINDAEVVVRLIASNGFCRRHCAAARDHVAHSYEDELKIVLLYDHLVRSLHRRLGEQPADVGPVHPRQDCPICTVERNAETQIVHWIRDGLAVPEIAELYAESSGLCLRHLFQLPERDRRLESPVRGLLDATRPWLDRGGSVPGTLGERVALSWGGGWLEDQIDGEHSPDCPICQETGLAEMRALRAMAEEAHADTSPCREHTRALRSILKDRDWPHDLAGRIVQRVDALLGSTASGPPAVLPRPRLLGRGRHRAVATDVSRSDCSVCRETDAVASAALSKVRTVDLGERGCLGHIAALGRSRPACWPTLNVALRSRLERLGAMVHEVCQFDRVPREARRGELAELARDLTVLFLPPREGSGGNPGV